MSTADDTSKDKTISLEGAEICSGPGGARDPREQVAKPEPKDRVEQVREILFGAQREEYDRRFSDLEELLAKNLTDLTNDTARKIAALRNDYDKRLARLEELLINNISDLSSDTARKVDALTGSIDEVRSQKVDKTAVSKLFQQILKLGRDFDISTSDDAVDEK